MGNTWKPWPRRNVDILARVEKDDYCAKPADLVRAVMEKYGPEDISRPHNLLAAVDDVSCDFDWGDFPDRVRAAVEREAKKLISAHPVMSVVGGTF